ncbi:MAG: acetyl-CoA carboxylase, carboxyltransferase subunit beta [Planctomycetota bacterium]|nr:acetyl-CoA carboxylase, carboxyltransferase subunit beta [Planctomycetota bacterium]
MALTGRRAAREESNGGRRNVQTEAQFRKCGNAECGQTLFVGDIERHFYCCKHCDFHFRVNARKRVEITLDEGSWVELFDNLETVDALGFKAHKSYLQSLDEGRAKSGEKEAVLCGEGRIEGQPLVFCVMDFQFIGASMGSVVGEKIARAIEHGTAKGWPVAIVCCSGGARMQEGALSLMQMAKTSAALQRHNEAGLGYYTILSDPTLAGVSASFAFLADVIVGEPGAMIGFTGARVIEQTIKVRLPEGFQTSEFLLKYGQIDMVVPRKDLRPTLSRLLGYARGAYGRSGPRRPAPALDAPPLEPEPAVKKEERRRAPRAAARKTARKKRTA